MASAAVGAQTRSKENVKETDFENRRGSADDHIECDGKDRHNCERAEHMVKMICAVVSIAELDPFALKITEFAFLIVHSLHQAFVFSS